MLLCIDIGNTQTALALYPSPADGEAAAGVAGWPEARWTAREGWVCKVASGPATGSRVTRSVARRLRQKATVLVFSTTSRAMRRDTSRPEEPRTPCSSSSNGGFHSAIDRSPRGDPSSLTAVTGSPHSEDASVAGSPMVAEENTKVGDDP